MTEHINAPAPAPAFPGGMILGYPRIGRMRELKKALESFWKGASSEADLEAAAAAIRAKNRSRLEQARTDVTRLEAQLAALPTA